MKLNRRLGYLLLVVFLLATIGLALVACKDPTPEPQTGEEAGAYYYDAVSDEYAVVLGEGLQFTLNIAGTTMAGKYELNDGALVLTSNKQEDSQISAILKDNAITLTFGGAEYRFLKKVNYTVTFNSNGGSAVNSATVVNGKKVSQPADPDKEGFIFVGWYSDATFSAPFSFNSIITANTTVYARWVEKQVGALEFTVNFDADNGAANPEPKTTVSGGKLFNLPVVEKSGYVFKGWWVSMNGDDTLSYEYTEGMAFDADTTLHAVWQASNLGSKLADPLVNVDSNSIKWNNVGAREYLLQVKDAEGNFIIDKTVGGTAENINFVNYPAGDYTVTVTAVAASGEQNNAVCTRVYKNKAIARVSQFKVIEPATLLFNAVENAEKYLIKVTCGDLNHNHNKQDVYFDNGAFTHFSFADCMMGNSGIKFTVIATANGFATSTSQEFTYAPTLDAITAFKFDEQTQTLTWTPVANATGYMVSVKSGNGALSEQFVNVGAVNSVCLKECSNVDGGIVVKVYPVSQMFISPEAASYTFNKQNLATPQNIRIQGTTVSWSAVDGATSYEVRIAGATLNTNTNSIDLSGKVALTERENYTLTVVANGTAPSVPTDPVDARILAMADVIKYSNGVLSWAHVVGADKYEVQVNEDAAFTVSDGLNFAGVNLSQAGENTLKVRFIDENGTAFEWVSLNVFAHTVTFVSDGGSSVSEQFKAVGDSIELPKPQKEGYEFLNWYQTPKGPETNGAAFKDTVFKATGDLVLYACYTSKAYTVTYHYGNGGNGVDVNDVAYYQQGFTWAVPQANDATSAFGGWFSAPNGNGVQYTDDKGNSLNPWTKLENADVYAFWFDDVLNFTLTNNGAGRQIYAVMQGSRISQVSEVTIPETYKGVKVGMIFGNAFKNCSNLVTINIPNTIEIISDVDPFTGCSSLSAINVYEVEGNNSIRYWSADGVLFDNGRLDQQPSDPSQIKSAISFMPLGKTGSYTIPNGIVEIPSLAFANSALTRVVIPASVATIGMQAFKDCLNLTTVVFDSGSKTPLTIGDAAFSGCKALVTITLPARLTSISLTKYELLRATGTPATQQVSLETGTNAFVGCKNLQNIYIAGGNTVYKSQDGIIYNANGSQLLYALPSVRGNVVVPNGVTTIADGAFIGCDYIDSVTIPNTILTIGECAFYATDIETVKFEGLAISNTDVTIGKYAFRDCDNLMSVTFESGNRIANIGDGAFYGCDELESITLPANLKSVGAQAFRDCSYLGTLDMSATNNEVTFGSDAFYNCSRLKSLTLPKNVKELPGVFSGCTSLGEVIVDENNPYFTSEDGVLFDKAKTTILFYPQNKYDSEYAIPETVTTISDGVFRGNENLESVTIGKNVTYIGADAFRECDELEELIFEEGGTQPLEIGAYAFAEISSYYFRSVALPDRTKKVGEYAFAEISYLNSFTFNEGLEEISDGMLYNAKKMTTLNIPASVTRIGKEAFYNVGYSDDVIYVTFADGSKLETIDEGAFSTCASYASASKGLSIDLPQGLKTIGKQAFYYTGFASITIPNSVTTIGMEAFNRSKVTSITFEDGDEDLIFAEEYVESYSGNYYSNAAFTNCSGLTSIEFPSRLTYLGARAFYNNSYIKSVSFGENSRLKAIGEYAFYSSGLETITIPNTVANGTYVIDEKGTQQFRLGIGSVAFASMSNITEINFASGGTEPLSIGIGAFNNYSKLTTVNLPARIADYTDADGNVVNGLSELTFASAYSSTSITHGQSSSSKLTAINIEQGGSAYCSVDGIVYTADKKTIVLCPAAKTGKVTIGSEVTLIADYAFANAKIDEIEFVGGNDNMVIGVSAFYHCVSITEVVLSDNVVEMKEGAFGYCDALTSFTLSASISTFDPKVFDGTKLQQINVSQNNSDFSSENGIVFNKDKTVLISYPATITAETYTVPSTVKEIAANAFEKNTNLKTVVLPAGLVTIGASAFNACIQLTNLTIPNTVQTIGAGAFNGCTSLGEVTFQKGGSAQLVIETYAFQNAGVTAVELPARLTTIGNSVFYGDTALTSLTFEQGCRLDSIGERAFYRTAITTITLPQGLSILGDYVFASCANLTSVTFGDGLTKIGDRTFDGCSSLASVTFPASLKTMGKQTFANVTTLTSVSFGQGSQLERITEGTFYGCTSLERITIPASVKVIEGKVYGDGRFESGYYGAFQNCSSLVAVTFEEGSKCVELGHAVFSGCTSLEAFVIPSSVASLGRYLFERCSSLTEIVIPSTATVYGEYLFSYCTSLARVTLNDKTTALPNGMFSNCSSLKQITIPASVTSFGSSLFYGTGFETFEVPSNMTTIPYSFLASCKSLTSVILPENLTTIERSAFSGSALKTIVIPSKVTSIGNNAFANCTSLTSVTLPDSLESVVDDNGECSVFTGCTSLLSIELPNKITAIGKSMFAGCTSLTTVKLPLSVKEIYSNAFNNCLALENYVMDNGGNDKYKVVDGVLFNGDATAIVNIPAKKTSLALPDTLTVIAQYAFADTGITTITVPASITAIGNYAFADATELQEVIFLGNVVTIGYYAFDGCVSLSTISLPASVTQIGDYAFRDCNSLTSINLPEGLTDLGRYAFRGCTKLTSVEIPNGISSLSYTFYGCTSLETVKLPTSITSLDSYVFSGCTSLASLTMDNGGNDRLKLFDGAVYALDSDGQGNERTTLQYIPAAKTGALALPSSLYSISSSSVLSGATGLTNYTMSGENAKYKVIDGALYTYTQNNDGDITSLVLYSVPIAKAGVLTLPRNMTSINSYCVLNDCTLLTGYAMEDCDGISFEVVKEDGTNNLYEIASDETRTLIKAGVYRVIDGALYQIKMGYDSTGYSADGQTSVTLTAPVAYNLVSVAAGRTGTFTISKYVTGRNIDDNAFKNSKLDLVKFEECDRNHQATDADGNLLWRSASGSNGYALMIDTTIDAAEYYAKWLLNATTVKAIVISVKDVDTITGGVFKNWTAAQTIYFVESQEEVSKVWSGTTKADVVYNYEG